MTVSATLAPDVLRIDCARETERIISVMRDQVFHQLRRKGAVIGVSGGIDSSVVAFLCARAFGKERAMLLFMPEADSSPESLKLGHLIAEASGAPWEFEDISAILKGARCYERRDAAIRSVIPEYGPGYKSKIVLPNMVERRSVRGLFRSCAISQR